MNQIEYKFGITSFGMHVLAMVFMLCDHMWATIIPGNMWLTNIGRIAFPLFAFMLVEGFYHTKNLKKYTLRLFIGALISEIPFNLMYGGSIIYPFHQNVIWTLLLSMLCMIATELFNNKSIIIKIIMGIIIFGFASVIATVTMMDYYGFGILTVALFYFIRGNSWWKKVLQLIGLYVINVILLGGMIIDVTFVNHTFEIVQQGLAILAMVPIILYTEEKGYSSKLFQYFCYLFYPLHMLVLSLIALI